MYPLNVDRAGFAETALAAYRQETGSDWDTVVTDLLADLMHFCDLKEKDVGTFGEAAARAEYHYNEELLEEQEGS